MLQLAQHGARVANYEINFEEIHVITSQICLSFELKRETIDAERSRMVLLFLECRAPRVETASDEQAGIGLVAQLLHVA